jgi:dihydrodipicolinate synthase/N-acetylneuraminate lyase
MNLPLTGVYAALITPCNGDGRVNFSQFDRLIDFVMEREMDGLCIGGGTSEYPHFGLEQRKQLISHAAARLGDSGALISAIGASSFGQVKTLAEHAASVGTTAVLLPPPHFYPYEQQDLATFYQTAADITDIPCLIYNLPAFTQPLEPTTIRSLLTEVPSIGGIKDSSGRTDHLRNLADLREDGQSVNLLCGSDEVFLPALQAGWDGSISGLASCCPELLTAIFRAYHTGDNRGTRRAHELLHEFADHVRTLPFPWGIRVAAEVRGIENGPLALPLSPARKRQISNLRETLNDWFSEHLSELGAIGNP